MTDQSTTPPPSMPIEAASEFRRAAFKIRAGFRTAADAIAGGIVSVEFFVESAGPRPFYLAVGGSRLRLRPGFFDVSASFEGSEVELDEVSDLGGPAGATAVEPNSSFRQTLLVNDFVRLEKLRTLLAEGESGTLHVLCQRRLPLATVRTGAFKGTARSPLVEAKLAVAVRRDDAALELEISQLVDQIQADKSEGASDTRELAVAKLSSLRSPLAFPYLESLEGHSDPVVARYVAWGLEFLDQNQGP